MAQLVIDGVKERPCDDGCPNTRVIAQVNVPTGAQLCILQGCEQCEGKVLNVAITFGGVAQGPDR